MIEAVFVGITAALGYMALGLGMFVLGAPSPTRSAEKRDSVSHADR
jgi:hypothetical protein